MGGATVAAIAMENPIDSLQHLISISHGLCVTTPTFIFYQKPRVLVMAPAVLDQGLERELPVTPSPTRTTPVPETLIFGRQITTVTVSPGSGASDSGGGNGGGSSTLDGGSIAGIVIGSVVGLILIIYLVRWAAGYQIAGDTNRPPPRRNGRDYYYRRETTLPGSRSRIRGIEGRPVRSSRSPRSPARVLCGIIDMETCLKPPH